MLSLQLKYNGTFHQSQQLFCLLVEKLFSILSNFFQIDYCLAHPSWCILILSVGKNKPKEFSNDRPQLHKPARTRPAWDALLGSGELRKRQKRPRARDSPKTEG
nr:MAG TPA: hypothetical protein [Caudoviricetes sp.]